MVFFLWLSLTISGKSSILDVWYDSEYATALPFTAWTQEYKGTYNASELPYLEQILEYDDQTKSNILVHFKWWLVVKAKY